MIGLKYLVTGEEMRSYDNYMIEEVGIPQLVLMERAALAVCEELVKLAGNRRKVLVVAGVGNNGADGLALARLLSSYYRENIGCFQVDVLVAGRSENATPAWKKQREILWHYPVQTGSALVRDEYDILVDAAFGVGLSREITGGYADLVKWWNRTPALKIAVDMPSGICADTGHVMGCAMKSDVTVTFSFEKRGLYLEPGCEYAGKIIERDIGIGFTKEPGMFAYTEALAELLPERRRDGNKGTFGKVLLAAGSHNMAGAAVLAARSCLRSGCGMVKVLTPECNRVIVQQAVPEAMVCTDESWQGSDSWPDVLAIGPGLGTDARAKELMRAFLAESRLPLVIDADGLNLLAADEQLLALAKERAAAGRCIIMTPHVGELARLTGKSISQIKEFPVKTARDFAKETKCVIVSKDARTLICDGGENPICMNLAGNHGMATAGSGDVLTGIVAGLLAQGMDGFEGASVAVYFHSLAGDIAAEKKGPRCMTAMDIVEYMYEAARETK